MSEESAVAFYSVRKAYDAVPVLDELTLEFPAGKTTAIVGASGSGKTTLLQLINGLEKPDAGSVRVFGEPVPEAELAAFRRRIGYSVQGAGLFPHLTVMENVTLVARLDRQGAASVRERLERLFDAMELPLELGDRYPHELSGGQQQRAGLCRALFLRPELLLLDEPFSAIDPITRAEVYRLFERVRASAQVTTVLVTHDMREAVRLADELVILLAGRVLQQGATQAVLAEPADAYVEQLVSDQL